MIKNRKISVYKIKKIIRCFCADIKASKTAIILNINRNTINRYYNLFRNLIYSNQLSESEKLFGNIEVDEAYFGAKRVRGQSGKRKRGRGTLKQPVFGIFERNGRVYTEIVPNCKKDTLQALIIGKISLDSVIHSDGWRGYNGLVDIGYNKHYRVNPSKNEFSKGKGIHVNGIESFWSFCKRRLAKFNGVKKNFDLHLKDSEWRWNKSIDQLEKELWSMVKFHQKHENLLV